jgi:hypothetical protein
MYTKNQNKMKKITVFKLSDGSLIEDEAKAIEMEKRIVGTKELNDLLFRKDYDDNESNLISIFILENLTALKDIINRM